MRAGSATLGLAALASLAAAASVSRAGECPAIRAAWLDVEGRARGLGGVARAECRSLLGRAGLDVVWRRAPGGEEALPGEIRVVLVNRLVVDPRDPQSILILGATPPRRAPECPVVFILLGSLRATLGLPPGSSLPDLPLRSRQDVGVALGRVAAHEIVHNLAPQLPHGPGLMSPRLKLANLFRSRLELEPWMAEAVHDALGCGAVPDPADRRLVASSGGPTPPP